MELVSVLTEPVLEKTNAPAASLRQGRFVMCQ
jgi:hypothetical protein